MIEIPMYAVRKQGPQGEMVVLSAWTDVFDARYEAARWEQDSKVRHDYIPVTLVLRGEDEEIDNAHQGSLSSTL